jgi:hypothetical protein
MHFACTLALLQKGCIEMIVIPMLGRSSRFFTAGYSVPKYQLPLGGESVFAHSVRSFESQFHSTSFLFLVRSDHDARNFVAREIQRLGIKDYRIIEFAEETRGQAESVAIGIAEYHDSVPLLIFNIDTIRHNFQWPQPDQCSDGFLEVFKAEGDGWSFVEPTAGNKVARTTEKQRISDLCSNGLYSFAHAGDFRAAYCAYVAAGMHVNGELYIAPLYNFLIERGLDIRYRLISHQDIDHCGVPGDYERLKRTLGE